MKANAVHFILTSTFMFSLMNVCIKLVPNIPSYEVVFFRSFISLIISGFILFKLRLNPFKKGNKLFLFIRGLAGSVGLILYFITLRNLPLATAVTLQYLSPIFTVIFASFILKEHMRWQQWIFFLVSFIGIFLIKGFDNRVSLTLISIGVLSAACSGVAYNAMRKVKDDEPAIVVVFFLPLITIPIITPFCFHDWVVPNNQEMLLLFAIGVITLIGQYFMTRAYQMEKASKIANYNYLGILFALAFGYFIFQEKFNILAIAGMGLVIFGIILNYFFLQRVTSAKRLKVYLRNFSGF